MSGAIPADLALRVERLFAVLVVSGLLLAIWSVVARRRTGARIDAAVRAWEASVTPRGAALAVWAAALGHAAVYSVFTILRHRMLNSTGYDLAIEDQVLWNLAHGRGFASSIEVSNYLGDHFCPILAPVSLLYRIWGDVRMILIAQSCWLALGAPAAYRIALATTRRPAAAALVGIGYLLVPAIGFMNKFDYHIVTLSIPVLLWAIVAWLERRRWLWAGLLVAALLIREEVGLAVAPLALAGVRRPRWRVLGAVVGVGALAWSVAALFVWIPHFREGVPSDTLQWYAYLGKSPAEILGTLARAPWTPFVRELSQERRLFALFQIALPTGGLALLSPGVLVLGGLVFLQNFVSDNLCQASIYFHYLAPAVPALVWAWAAGAARALRWAERGSVAFRRIAVFGWLAVAPLAAQWLDRPLLDPVTTPYAEVYGLEAKIDRGVFERARSLVPAGESVLASEPFAAHFSHRLRIQVYHSAHEIVPDEDWIVVHLDDRRHLQTPSDVRDDVRDWIGALGYRARFFEDGLVVLSRRGTEDPTVRTALTRELAPH